MPDGSRRTTEMMRLALYVAANLVGAVLVLFAWIMPEARWALVGLAAGVVAGLWWVARGFPPTRGIHLRGDQLRKSVLVGGLLVALVAVSLGWWHHETGARFQATIRPITSFGSSGCARELKSFGWGSSPVRQR